MVKKVSRRERQIWSGVSVGFGERISAGRGPQTGQRAQGQRACVARNEAHKNTQKGSGVFFYLTSAKEAWQAENSQSTQPRSHSSVTRPAKETLIKDSRPLLFFLVLEIAIFTGMSPISQLSESTQADLILSP